MASIGLICCWFALLRRAIRGSAEGEGLKRTAPFLPLPVRQVGVAAQEAGRLAACTQAVVNISDDALWNLLSSCSNTGAHGPSACMWVLSCAHGA